MLNINIFATPRNVFGVGQVFVEAGLKHAVSITDSCIEWYVDCFRIIESFGKTIPRPQ